MRWDIRRSWNVIVTVMRPKIAKRSDANNTHTAWEQLNKSQNNLSHTLARIRKCWQNNFHLPTGKSISNQKFSFLEHLQCLTYVLQTRNLYTNNIAAELKGWRCVRKQRQNFRPIVRKEFSKRKDISWSVRPIAYHLSDEFRANFAVDHTGRDNQNP